MSETDSPAGIGDLTRPATVLIERISDAVGGIFKPYQMIRVARAQAEANRIQAEVQIEIADIHRRAFQRFLNEEATKQDNIENVTRLTLPQLDESASPESIETDWITNFFDKCRLASDLELQQLWARVLAGEANQPGRFSRRTVNFLASIDKRDAELFTSLCSFCWTLVGDDDVRQIPVVLEPGREIYKAKGVTGDTLIAG